MGKRTAAFLAAALGGASLTILMPTPAMAALPAPIILNNGAQNSGNAQWMETQAQPDDGGATVKQFWATFLVQHAVGRSINTVNIVGPGANTNVAVTGQTYVASAGGIETSRVTVAIALGKPGGFSCPIIGSATRSVDANVTMRVIDSTSEQSAPVTTSVKFVEDSNCSARADFPRMTGVSQNLTEVTPGQNITYSFTCDDVDSDVLGVTNDDDCDRANIRWRRLDDGDVSSNTLKTGMDDNTGQSHVVSFPSQGIYVVEAQLGNEDGNFPNLGGASQGWWRLGNAVVNDAASSLSGSIALSGTQPSSPPSVNPGAAVTATATVADTGGAVQVIEWDADGNSAFERREYTVPTNTGGNIVHPALTAPELQQSINTATSGLKTVNARITDNGAIDGADNVRRQLSFNGQLRVNAIPTASNVNASTNEDTPLAISLVGNDSDNQPAPLTYSIVSGPPVSAGSLGPVSGNSVTFTPAANFNGSTSFTYRVTDGPGDDGDAFANSNTATVSVTVNAVNDPPIVDPKSATTNEDTPVTLQATGSDVEGPLTWTVANQPGNGSAACNLTTGLCTYTPALNFNGVDTFVVRGTDNGSPGLSATATFTVTVNAVNDAPVANAQTVNVPEDSVNFPINLTASDVDSITLTFTAPIDNVDHGSITCLGQACTYTPTPDYNGPDSFTFTVSDGSLSDTETITINVTPVNDAPIATDVLDAETDEDIDVDITTTGTDIDAGDVVTLTGATDPPNGTATAVPPATTNYLGDLNFFGIDTFDFTVSDGNGGTDTGTVMVTVKPVNDAPVVEDQEFTINEDTPSLLSVAASDVDGDALTWSVVSPPSSGALFGSGPDVGYAPLGNFNDDDTFVVQVDDGNGGTDTATITVHVLPVNDQPLATASSILMDEDSTANFTLDASDLDGDTLTISAPVAGPFNGTAVCTGAACSYQPNANFHGSDVFTFSVDDGNGGTDTASVSITIDSVNDQPMASPASATTPEDTPVAVSLVASDIEGDNLTYSTTAPGSGVVQGIAPDVVYVPNTNSFGSDSFDFTVNDGNGGTATETVTINVTPVNDAPVATGGTVVTPEETPVNFQLGGTDIENDTLTFTVTVPPDVGTLTCDPTGACNYSPPADFSGSAIIRYDVSDGSLTDSGVFTVSVDQVNDPPVVNNSMASTPEDTALNLTLSASDTEGDDLDYTIEAQPVHGTLVCGSDNTSCTYTPSPNYNGPDEFTWAADDGHAGHATATVSIDVTPVNDAPDAGDTSAVTDEEVTVGVPLIGPDPEGDAVTFSIVTPPAHGTVSVSGATANYTPAIDYNGTDTFRYRATDPSGAFTEANATVIVTGLPLISTSLDAQPATALIELNLGVPLSSRLVFLQLGATLRTPTGAGLAGRGVQFHVGTRFICAAVTNANGFATCGSRQAGLAATLNLGYRATFGGDNDYSPSAATGILIGVFAARIP